MTSCKLHIFQCQVGCFKLILEKQLRTNNFHLLPEQFRLEILALSFYFCKQDPMLRNMAVESDSFCTDQQFLFLFSMIEFHKIVFLFSRPQNFLMLFMNHMYGVFPFWQTHSFLWDDLLDRRRYTNNIREPLFSFKETAEKDGCFNISFMTKC